MPLINKYPIVDYCIIELLIQVILWPEQRRFISRIHKLILEYIFSLSLWFYVSKITIIHISILIKKTVYVL